MNPADLQDPRIQKLIAALKGQQGHTGGGPVFGGGARTGGGGAGIRGRADFFRPGLAGINYNPLQAQMAAGAPGILGLNSGTDTNAPQSIPGSQGDPSEGVTGMAPPSIGDAITEQPPYDGGAPDPNNPGGVGPYGRSRVINGQPDNGAPNPYARGRGAFYGGY